MIWVISILHFAIVFLINDRMIANKGDRYVNYSNVNHAEYLLIKTNGTNTKSSRNTQGKGLDYLTEGSSPESF